MGLPYKFSGEIGDTVRLDPAFCRWTLQVLSTGDLLSLMMFGLRALCCFKDDDKNFERLISSLPAYFVLRHILYRTIQFNRPVEFVRVADIIHGLPTIVAFGCGQSERTVRNVLNGLSFPKSDVLVRIRLRPSVSQTSLYGLNLPVIFGVASKMWKEALAHVEMRRHSRYVEDRRDEQEKEFEPNSTLARATFRNLKRCYSYVEYFEPCYELLVKQVDPVEDFNQFLEAIARTLPSSSDRKNADRALGHR